MELHAIPIFLFLFIELDSTVKTLITNLLCDIRLRIVFTDRMSVITMFSARDGLSETQ